MPSTDIPLAKHVERAQRHKTVGEVLVEAGDEWGAVCLFYSAYHVVRFALRSDPVFDDPTLLSRIRADLTMDERNTERHKGRRTPPGGGREWDINELVMLLYRPLAASYEKLHQASIEVRYGEGLGVAAVADLPRLLGPLFEDHEAGRLNAATLCPALR